MQPPSTNYGDMNTAIAEERAKAMKHLTLLIVLGIIVLGSLSTLAGNLCGDEFASAGGPEMGTKVADFPLHSVGKRHFCWSCYG
jgi:hypothetical protein